MANLGNPEHTIEIIQEYQFVFQKWLGQNFLMNTHVLDKIISVAGITKQGCVLETGPGTDTTTQYLAEHIRRVVVVEIDSNLLPILDETLKGYTNITVINDDILKVDVGGLVNGYNEGCPIKVVANPPYYIITPTIMGPFESDVPIDNITVMVQGEVADRIRVGLRPRDYGALSLAVQYYVGPYIVVSVSSNCFIPRPNVGSVVIRPTRHEGSLVQVDDPKFMFKLVRVSSDQRRKTLQDGPNNSPEIPYDREVITKAIESLSVQPVIKGEALSLDQFAQLSNYFTRNV